MVQKWFKNGSKMVQKWFKNGSKMVQNDRKIVTNTGSLKTIDHN